MKRLSAHADQTCGIVKLVQRTASVLALMAAAAALGVTPTEAGPISLGATANAAISPGHFDQHLLSATLSPTTDQTITALASGTYTTANLDSSLDVSTSGFVRALAGSVALGIDIAVTGDMLIASGSHSMHGPGNVGLSVSEALDIVGGPASGFIALVLALSGDLDTSASGFNSGTPVGAASATLNVSGQQFTANASSVSGPASSAFPAALTVVLPYHSFLASYVLGLSAIGTVAFSCGQSCGADANISNLTLLLSHIEVRDLLGAPVAGAFVRGGSGIHYNNSATPATVPEPTSLLLFGTGGLGLLVAMRRRNAA